ncbi:MAG: acetoacetate decarboxylase family protein, partial [Flavonifractor plautii]
MSYVRNDSLMYQMPVHFGPCVTPRQNKEGKRFIYDQATRLTKHTIVYESDPEALSAVLPQRFELAAPYVIINMNMLRDVAWLAGHGYNLTGVSVPTRFHGEKGVVEGNLLLV